MKEIRSIERTTDERGLFGLIGDSGGFSVKGWKGNGVFNTAAMLMAVSAISLLYVILLPVIGLGVVAFLMVDKLMGDPLRLGSGRA